MKDVSIFYLSMALQLFFGGGLGRFFNFLILYTFVRTPWQGRYLHTGQQKQRINARNPDIHVLSGIRTHDPSVRASEDSSCLRHAATVISSVNTKLYKHEIRL
jgi:hypothetical protein